MKFKKNIPVTVIRKLVLIPGLLFFSLLVNAQDEELAPAISDTTIVDAPADEYREETGDTKKGYFNKRRDTLAVSVRSIPGDVVKEMKEDKDFWYANSDIKNSRSKEVKGKTKEKGVKGEKGKEEQAIEQERDNSYVPLGQRSWFQTLLWIVIVGGFAAFLVIYLTGSNVGLFRKKNILQPGNEEEEMITEDIFAINYQKEIDKAAAQGNYRLAIRLMFLRLLKNMSEKNIIRYKQDKTNFDYLLELHPTQHYNSFFRVTRNYEYSWYGKFPVSEDAYKVIRSDFDQFDKQLN